MGFPLPNEEIRKSSMAASSERNSIIISNKIGKKENEASSLGRIEASGTGEPSLSNTPIKKKMNFLL